MKPPDDPLATPREVLSRLGGRTPAIAVFVLSLIVTAIGWDYVRLANSVKVTNTFTSLVRGISHDISEQLATYEEMLYSSRAFVLASPKITRSQWLRFQGAQLFETYHPGSLGIGYAVEVRRADVDRYVHAINLQDEVNYKIWPAGERPVYAPIRFSASHNRDTRALGLDMYSDVRRKTAMERARDTDKAVLSEIVTLVKAGPSEAKQSIILFLAVYGRELPANSPLEERRGALLSYVYCPILIDAFLRDVKDTLGKEHIDLEIADQNGEMIISTRDASTPESGSFSFTEERNTYGQSWFFRYTALPEFARAASNSQAALVAGSGTIISLLLFAMVWSTTSTRLRAVKMAREMTRDLRESEGRFRELTELSSDWYWEQDEDLRFTLISPGAPEKAGFSGAVSIGKTRWEQPGLEIEKE